MSYFSVSKCIYLNLKLVKLKREYQGLSQEEISENDDDLYFNGIFRTLEKLILEIQAVKDEL